MSSYGRVRALPGIPGKSPTAMGGRKPRVLKCGGKSRYATVMLGRKTYMVHVLVAATFIGPRPQGLFVCHKDDMRRNNHDYNLYYGTRAQNEADKKANGRVLRGESAGNSKLSDESVRQIRSLTGKETVSGLSRKFGVCRHAIRSVASGRTWAHVV